MEIQVQPDGELKKREWKYWDAAETVGSTMHMSEDDMIEQARELMEKRVKLRLISDVPLGLFLSGALIPARITAFASRNSAEKVKTFTIGFPAASSTMSCDGESGSAEIWHRPSRFAGRRGLCQYMTKVVRHFDEPFGNPTAILQYIITKLMRKHVTVAISGDGGDELFGGYVRYAGAAMARQ